MAVTLLDQETQIRSSFPVVDNYIDSVAPTEAAYETNTTNLNDDLNNLRSQVNNVINRDGAGFPATDWFADLVAPSAIEAGSVRGINANNSATHDLEVKRFLDCNWGLDSIAGGAGQGVSLGAGELPGNLIAAIGASTELGTVVQTATAYGTYSAADVVAGTTAINPYNMVQIVDAVTRDPILDAGDRIYGLLQCESAVDGSTMTIVAGDRVQISFVKISGGSALALITAGAMNTNFDYCYVEQHRFQDLTRGILLRGANVDLPAGTTVTRQAGYTNQGTTPVDLLTNATLDLEAAGIEWGIRDDLEAKLFGVIEGSAGGTSQLNIYGDVDEFDVDAIVNNFANGISQNTGGTRPIDVGVTDGVIESTAGDLMVKGFAELLFDDVNQTGSTWAQDGIKLSEDTGEWDAFETLFGEVSLLNAITQAGASGVTRRKVNSICVVKANANVDVSGPSDDANLDTDLGDLSAGTFVTATGDGDYDIALNGDDQVLGINVGAGKDVYPGTALANGQLRFDKKIKVGNVITVIAWV